MKNVKVVVGRDHLVTPSLLRRGNKKYLYTNPSLFSAMLQKVLPLEKEEIKKIKKIIIK